MEQLLDQPQIADLDLYKITQNAGLVGLKNCLSIEAGMRFDQAEQQQLQDAYEWASFFHSDDMRGHEPYMNHLLRVAIWVMRYCDTDNGTATAEATKNPINTPIAAILHDVVENHANDMTGLTGEPAQKRAFDILAGNFGSEVASMVFSVTNPVFRPDIDRQTKNAQYCNNLHTKLQQYPKGRIIKAGDLVDNGVNIIHSEPAKQPALAEKYSKVFPFMKTLIARSDTPLSATVKTYIIDQFDIGQKNCAEILESSQKKLHKNVKAHKVTNLLGLLHNRVAEMF